jgi:Cupin domain
MVPPGHSTPLDIHRDQHEAFYVLAGAVDLVCGDERFRAEAGDCLHAAGGSRTRSCLPSDAGIFSAPAATPGGLEEAFAAPDRFVTPESRDFGDF